MSVLTGNIPRILTFSIHLEIESYLSVSVDTCGQCWVIFGGCLGRLDNRNDIGGRLFQLRVGGVNHGYPVLTVSQCVSPQYQQFPIRRFVDVGVGQQPLPAMESEAKAGSPQ